MTAALRALLDDPSDEVAERSIESMREIHASTEVERLLGELAAEINPAQKWVLLDALVALGDPGDGRNTFPDWVKQGSEDLSRYQRRYLSSALDSRAKDQTKQAEWDDRIRYA